MAIGEPFLSAFLQVLFDRLATKDVLNFFCGHDIENSLKKLKMTVTNVESFLNDAENKQFEKKAVKQWLADLKDTCYDAEDVLDELATEALRMKLEVADQQSQTVLDQVWNFLPDSLNPTVCQLASKIQAITGRFNELSNRRYELGLEEIAAGSISTTIKFKETSSVVDESRVYGRDDDKEKITNMLLKYDPACDDEISVIPIIGMGGVGKTTLAQIVYNNPRVKAHFNHLRVWVCISGHFDVKTITKLILESLGLGRGSDVSSLNQLQEEVQQALRGKKFLIVLDDVWSKNYGDWDLLQNPFRVGAPGSKIVVTTRLEDVASMMGTVDGHSLKHLSDDDCWPVFVQHAFRSRKYLHTKPHLVEIGKKIVDKCKGLPLAVKTLGGLLRSKLNEDDWEDILNSNIWDLPEDENDILRALLLSYHHLPSHLKRCFAYCSIFPKDYEFEEEKLVLLWMAEGFLEQANGRKHMEDLGVMYFRDLVSRSFFQVSSSNRSFFVMHDLIHDVAQWVAGETSFGLEGEKQCIISKRVRHSSFIPSFCDGIQKFKAFEEAVHLRTFISLKKSLAYYYIPCNVPLMLLPKLQCLRVFSLRGCINIQSCSSVGELTHLRYLDLSGTSIECLPETTTNLYNLQTLLLEDCSKLKKLPAKMQNMINLRHLHTGGAYSLEEMPTQLGKLTNLQELSNFIVGNNCGSSIKELMNLKQLKGAMCISRLENVVDVRDAREAILKDKRNLEVVRIEWSNEFKDSRRNEKLKKAVLTMLQPHNLLKELTIQYYGGTKLPTWLGDPSFTNMTRLTLISCVNLTLLPPLGQLRSLKDIFIKGMKKVSNVGVEFYGTGCSKPFPSLEILRFEGMEEWKEWVSCGKLTHLRELSVKDCPKLVGWLPSHLCSLKELRIEKCPQLVISISSLPNLCEFSRKEGQENVKRSSDGLHLTFSDKSNVMRLTEGILKGVTNVNRLGIVGFNELTSSLWLGSLQLLESHECVHLEKLGAISMEGISSISLVTEELEREGLHCRLEDLSIHECVHLENLGGLHSFTGLTRLAIKECPRLVSFPEAGLPPTLKRLEIDDCRSLNSLPLYEATMMHTSLEFLHIWKCPSLKSLSSRGGGLTVTLKHLEIGRCPKLESLVENLHNNTTLETVWIQSCESLKLLPEGLHNLIHLRKFNLWTCPSLVFFPDGGLPATNLKELHILGWDKLVALSDGIHNLTCLEELRISDCPGILSFPEEGFPTNLTSLTIINVNICKPLLEWGLHKFTSLRELDIGGCPDVLLFPDAEDMLPISLSRLVIRKFPNLECLSSKGFQNLSSLEHLWISHCPKLKSFPEEGLPLSLLYLSIYNCPLLKQQYAENGGRDWHTIAHVPRLGLF